MPVRFLSPRLGGQRQTYFRPGEWQVGVAYRRLTADKWFFGSAEHPELAPFSNSGVLRPVSLGINSVDLSVTYAPTERLSVTATFPFLHASGTRAYADLQEHETSAFGLGDVNVVASMWLARPSTHPNGNIALGLGVKTPSGDNHYAANFWDANGNVSQQPVDQSAQLGDGGWGAIVQLQAFQQFVPRLYGYMSGFYQLSLKEHTDVYSVQLPTVLWSVPDVYSARLGLAYTFWPSQGLALSFGGRIDGIPMRDIIGGGDLYFRRPGYTLFVDPGLSFTLGKDDFTLTVPFRVHQNFQSSLIGQQLGKPLGGDLADHLVFLSVTHRF